MGKVILDKAKLAVRQGRKATGLVKIAGLPLISIGDLVF